MRSRAVVTGPGMTATPAQAGACDRRTVAEKPEEVDAALDTAVDRVRDAEGRFLETPLESGAKVVEASVVEHRAEDVDVLARQARDLRQVTHPPPSGVRRSRNTHVR
jgi:hypothetical protein